MLNVLQQMLRGADSGADGVKELSLTLLVVTLESAQQGSIYTSRILFFSS